MRISYKNAKTDLYKINNVLFKFKGSNFYKCKINHKKYDTILSKAD